MGGVEFLKLEFLNSILGCRYCGLNMYLIVRSNRHFNNMLYQVFCLYTSVVF